MSFEDDDDDYEGFTKSREKELKDLLSPDELASLKENDRKVESIRGILLETVNFLYKEYDVRGLRYFRRRIEACKTQEELRIAADCLLTIGRFHAESD